MTLAKNKHFRILLLALTVGISLVYSPLLTQQAHAIPLTNEPPPHYACGSNDTAGDGKVGFTPTSIDIGCQGDNCIYRPPAAANLIGTYNSGGTGSGGFSCSQYNSPITDAVFAIIRFLSDGAGIVIIASMIVAGIQYTLARDDPNAIAIARNRIQSNVIALVIFIFAYAILNYVIPGGFFN